MLALRCLWPVMGLLPFFSSLVAANMPPTALEPKEGGNPPSYADYKGVSNRTRDDLCYYERISRCLGFEYAQQSNQNITQMGCWIDSLSCYESPVYPDFTPGNNTAMMKEMHSLHAPPACADNWKRCVGMVKIPWFNRILCGNWIHMLCHDIVNKFRHAERGDVDLIGKVITFAFQYTLGYVAQELPTESDLFHDCMGRRAKMLLGKKKYSFHPLNDQDVFLCLADMIKKAPANKGRSEEERSKIVENYHKNREQMEADAVAESQRFRKMEEGAGH